jgi:hypothetical protein
MVLFSKKKKKKIVIALKRRRTTTQTTTFTKAVLKSTEKRIKRKNKSQLYKSKAFT